jgi:threonine dehydrogenase-like Zn-dependent dehydrogenase
VAEDSPLLASLLTLSDVLCTGHGAIKAGVSRCDTVTVIGHGAVGLCAVLAIKRLGAEQIILMGRHTDRTDLGRDFVVAKIRELTGGDGPDRVIECVGTSQALETAFGAVIDGVVVSRLGVPQYQEGPIGPAMLLRNITLTGGAAPAGPTSRN